MEKILCLVVLAVSLLVGFEKTAAALEPSFSDATKDSLIDSCRADLPKRVRARNDAVDLDIIDKHTKDACTCIFDFYQKPTNHLGKDKPFTDEEYDQLADFMEKNSKATPDKPASASFRVRQAGNIYPGALQVDEVKACTDKAKS